MSLSTVLLAYNEEENLKVMIPRIKAVLDKIGEDYDIIVVDTKNPTDNSKQVCINEGAKYVNQILPGFGGAYLKGIEEATGDKLLFLDSDGSHDPSYIPAIYERYCEGFDVVIGSRYTKGGTSDDKTSSKIMSHILNFVYRIVIGLNIKDVSTNFRIYRAELVKGLELKSVNYDVLEEILLRMKLRKGREKLRHSEIPISFNKRLYGESKRRLIPFIISYIKTVFRLIALRITA